MFGKHAAYIIPSYAITGLVIGVLVIWILAIYRKRRNEIADLDAKGISRGSGGKSKR